MTLSDPATTKSSFAAALADTLQQYLSLLQHCSKRYSHCQFSYISNLVPKSYDNNVFGADFSDISLADAVE